MSSFKREFFNLTEEHIKLLQWASWEFDSDDGYDGHVAQHSKRPYGSSDVKGDLVEILGKKAGNPWGFHRTLDTALEIVLRFKTFTPGRYYRDAAWENWQPLPEPPQEGK